MKGEKQMIYKNIAFKADPFPYDLAFNEGVVNQKLEREVRR